MIFNPNWAPNRMLVFQTNILDKGMKEVRNYEYPLISTRAWIQGQQGRIDIRLYHFIRDVLDKGFVNPLQVWTDGNYITVPYGMNRLWLWKLFPEINLDCLVIVPGVHDTRFIKNKFDKITELTPNKKGGNNKIDMKFDRRLPPLRYVKCGNLYELGVDNEKLIFKIPLENPEWDKEWKQLQKEKGFTLWMGNERFYSIGKPVEDYDVTDVRGIYQLFYKCFFDRNKTWDKVWYKRKQ